MGGVREYSVLGIRLNEKTDYPVVMLHERGNGRAFGIAISKMNVFGVLAASDREGTAKRCRRPLSHELTLALAEAAGFRVERVVIDRLTAERIFTAAVEVRRREGGETISLDARPSDAIPLAVAAGAPIFVADDVAAKVDFYPLDRLPYREFTEEDLPA
jgi:bifunctional DNase/RNase